MRPRRPTFWIAALVTAFALAISAQTLALPNRVGSLKFAAIGDNGTGDAAEYETADQMTRWHQQFAFDLVLMLGDNLYGRQEPADFVLKFERPYKQLLDAGAKNGGRPWLVLEADRLSFFLCEGGERQISSARASIAVALADSC